MNLALRYPEATRGTVVVWGLLANNPFGGMTWQVLHHLAGFRRLGFDVWYVEDTEAPLSSPRDLEMVCDPTENAAFLDRWMRAIGLADRWILRPPGEEECLGRSRAFLDALYARADAVFNLCGSHEMRERHAGIGCLVLLETDPVADQVAAATDNAWRAEQYRMYAHRFSYGQNLGAPDCPVPLLGLDWHATRPPVVCEWWADGPVPPDRPLTTVLTWATDVKDVTWRGRRYTWRKDVAFRPYLDLPARSPVPLELAVGKIPAGESEDIRRRGWRTHSIVPLVDPLAYRGYIQRSLGEFTAAKEQYTATNSGWFSDRSVCYLAAGRPVVTEETGFSRHVPVGEGLLSFATPDEAVEAVEAVAADPERHGRAAAEIAGEHFGAERVLSAVCRKVGLL